MVARPAQTSARARSQTHHAKPLSDREFQTANLRGERDVGRSVGPRLDLGQGPVVEAPPWVVGLIVARILESVGPSVTARTV